MNRFLFILFGALCFCACSKTEGLAWRDVPLSGERVTVMTYNVENLFDTRHDPGKNDQTFLPLAQKKTAEHAAFCENLKRSYWRDQCLYWDWSEAVLKKKLEGLRDAILSANDGRGPDVLILQEVENSGVLERLRRNLAPAEYLPGILIEGDDARGIDSAVLSRLEPAGPAQLHPIKGTRGILEVPLRLPDGEILSVFAIHFPSPRAPSKRRAQALRLLNRVRAGHPKGRMSVAGGDFNITASEDAALHLLDEIVSRQWLISHRLGCSGCAGTHYYSPKEEWSFLDMILLSHNLHPGGGAPWVVLRDSVRIPNGAPQQKNRYGSPARFDPLFGVGVSDHWPVILQLAKRK